MVLVTPSLFTVQTGRQPGYRLALGQLPAVTESVTGAAAVIQLTGL
jgi:hypothetical protein